MSYIIKFGDDDVLVNTVKSHPETQFYIYSGSAYYNNRPNMSGSFTGSILGAPDSGYVSLYELNPDRGGALIYESSELPPFQRAVRDEIDASTLYSGPNPPIQPFLIKNGTRISFDTVTAKQFNSLSSFGEMITGSYPLTSSIAPEYFPASTKRYVNEVILPPNTTGNTTANYKVTSSGSVTRLYALKNTLNFHITTSPNYAASSSLVGGPAGRDLMASGGAGAVDVGMVSIPSIFYGNTIKKGTVNLKFYVSGTLVGHLHDPNRNGELIQIAPTGSVGSGSVAGVVLYKEGFVLLTGSWALSDETTDTYIVGDGVDNARWKYFAQSMNGARPSPSSGLAPSSSYYLGFKGTSVVPNITMLAHAGKNMFNHSNNSTYTEYDTSTLISTGALAYLENNEISIKNTVSSSYNDPTGSFAKTTYISKVAIYDRDKNLIGIAKLATPLRKTEDRAFTIKMKIDI